MNFPLAKRIGYDGWAIRIRGAENPLGWTLCTTRDECRRLVHELWALSGVQVNADVVKVRMQLQVVE